MAYAFLGNDFLASVPVDVAEEGDPLADPAFVEHMRQHLAKSGYSEYAISHATFEVREA